MDSKRDLLNYIKNNPAFESLIDEWIQKQSQSWLIEMNETDRNAIWHRATAIKSFRDWVLCQARKAD